MRRRQEHARLAPYFIAISSTGAIRVEESDIVSFGKCYAPCGCHTDPEKAAQAPYGGLIASEAQVAAIMMRLLVDNFLSTVASIASPGCDERCVGRSAVGPAEQIGHRGGSSRFCPPNPLRF